MADLADTDHHLAHLAEAGQRLVRSVDGLTGDEWAAPSLLPGWSRAHVVAHLALNAEGLGGVLRGEAERSPAPMYESQESRDDDIEELAGADHAELRERLLAGTVSFPEAVQAAAGRPVGGPVRAHPRRADAAAAGRAADAGARDRDPPRRPRRRLLPRRLAARVRRGAGRRHGEAAAARRRASCVRPLDADRTWEVGRVGDDALVVTGPVAHLGWWLTGRTPSEQVSSSRGELPTIGGW